MHLIQILERLTDMNVLYGVGSRKRKRIAPAEQLEHLQGELRGLLHEAVGLTAPVALDDGNGVDFYDAVAEHERTLIKAALRMSGGSQKEAARLLHIGPSTLHSKIKALGIDLGKFN